MIADKIYKWLTGKFTDTHVVALLSIAMSVITYYITTTSFHDLSSSSKFIQSIEWFIMMPTGLIGLVISVLQIDGGSLENWGFLLLFIAPVTNLVFWFIVFWFASKGISKLFKSKNLLIKHALSFGLVIFLISPYLFYSLNANEMSACLSGKFNRLYHTAGGGIVPQGPHQCFERIVTKDLGSNLGNSVATSKYCNKLSESKSVLMETGATSVSHRDFCNSKLQINAVTLSSISPNKVSFGTQVTVRGSGFSKNELNVWLHDEKSNQYGILWRGVSPKDNEISFKMSEKLCGIATQSINNCAKYMNVVPGKYKIKFMYSSIFSESQTSASLDLEVI